MHHQPGKSRSYSCKQRRNDSDISGFICLPTLPEWLIGRYPKTKQQATYRLAVEHARAEVDPMFLGI